MKINCWIFLDILLCVWYFTVEHGRVFLFYKKLGKGDFMAKKKVEKENKEKKSLWSRVMTFCHGVKVESKRIHWISKKELAKYSVATLIFVIFFSMFFYLVDVIYALVHSLIG